MSRHSANRRMTSAAAPRRGALRAFVLAAGLAVLTAAQTAPAEAQSQGTGTVQTPAPATAPTTTAPSGLPLPRFVSLRAGEVNMRSGPGVQYPVDWVYKRRHLPMEVIAEFQTWRKVRDHQGTQGWVHQTMLDSDRTAIVLGRTRTLRADPDSNARALARLEPDVIVSVLLCPADGGWCRVKASGFEGWIRRVELWGVRKGETVE